MAVPSRPPLRADDDPGPETEPSRAVSPAVEVVRVDDGIADEAAPPGRDGPAADEEPRGADDARASEAGARVAPAETAELPLATGGETGTDSTVDTPEGPEPATAPGAAAEHPRSSFRSPWRFPWERGGGTR